MQATDIFLLLLVAVVMLFGIGIMGFGFKIKTYSAQKPLKKAETATQVASQEVVCMAFPQPIASHQADILTDGIKQNPTTHNKLKFEQPRFNGHTFANPVSFTTWVNPPSMRNFSTLLWTISRWFDSANIPPQVELDRTLPVQCPIFDLQSELSTTWLGHATLFVHMDGISFITDPVWSACAAPFGYFFCPRYRPSPCSIDQLPELHFSVISHNHYDHLDLQAVRLLTKRFPKMRWFVPKGLKYCMNANTPQGTWIEELSWGQSVSFSCHGKSFEIWCTPAQHWSQRGICDRNYVLWSSWAVMGPKHKFYFTGDSGFCTAMFQNIGDQLGPFDLAAIPIGCYAPNWHPQHMDPVAAVQAHQCIGATKSIAIHWGTYAMGSTEPYLEPKIKLEAACQAAGLSDQDFVVLHHGQTWSIDPFTMKDCML
ncbi:MBL fold metallo-hydrolase [Candidatus Cardinium hertigii]|jgi:N-acyl-phosphatidylethanolamine-hydrolysing phospholipase D|uniref:Metallo-beta-lactamase domain-containing protein n=1 Tax=Candidatus Cardinium hertigii TaxID=247481 RepID=A0A3N2QCT2_9BACT|nr:MBL fold metallo-hydrolase [Candidatus Cardinium hertigii]ROT47581.1 hypothetical protein EDM02_01560 [Candidatus Cardinium hertigii]ROT47591.1 hypothetical protein EDM02_01630 [Candidatus Cardinium hertigii]